jgi:hypothetical protein
MDEESTALVSWINTFSSDKEFVSLDDSNVIIALVNILQSSYSTNDVKQLLSCLLKGFLNQGDSYGLSKLNNYATLDNKTWAKFVLAASSQGLQSTQIMENIDSLGEPIRSVLLRIIDETRREFAPKKGKDTCDILEA